MATSTEEVGTLSWLKNELVDRCKEHPLAILLLVLVLCFLIAVLTLGSPERRAEQRREQLSTAQTPQTESTDNKDDPKLDRAALGAASVIAAARNPDSVKFSLVTVLNNGTACYMWRAQNGFGGLNQEHAVLLPNASNLNQSTAVWNSRCANKSGIDMTALIQQRMTLLQIMAGTK
jgi:hypothetical protein